PHAHEGSRPMNPPEPPVLVTPRSGVPTPPASGRLLVVHIGAGRTCVGAGALLSPTEVVNLSETPAGRIYRVGWLVPLTSGGRLIHAGEGSAGGSGGLPTKRSGRAA